MWVGFLYTFVFKLPSELGVTRVSKKGMDPSLLLSSMGKLNLLIYRIDVTDEAVFLRPLDDYKCIIHKSSPQIGGMWYCADGLFFKGLHIKVGYYGAYR